MAVRASKAGTASATRPNRFRLFVIRLILAPLQE
jgi:hypothetical protein